VDFVERFRERCSAIGGETKAYIWPESDSSMLICHSMMLPDPRTVIELVEGLNEFPEGGSRVTMKFMAGAPPAYASLSIHTFKHAEEKYSIEFMRKASLELRKKVESYAKELDSVLKKSGLHYTRKYEVDPVNGIVWFFCNVTGREPREFAEILRKFKEFDETIGDRIGKRSFLIE